MESSVLDQFATVAMQVAQTPRARKTDRSEGIFTPKSTVNPDEAAKPAMGVSPEVKARQQVMLSFDQKDMDLCSKLSLLRHSDSVASINPNVNIQLKAKPSMNINPDNKSKAMTPTRASSKNQRITNRPQLNKKLALALGEETTEDDENDQSDTNNIDESAFGSGSTSGSSAESMSRSDSADSEAKSIVRSINAKNEQETDVITPKKKRQYRQRSKSQVGNTTSKSPRTPTIKSPRKYRKKDEEEEESPRSRKKRKNEWNDDEIIVLLQVTKLMIDCELKSVAKALFECINRSPGKSYGRAAEKKLKRMEIFENWKKCDREQTLINIDKKLMEMGISITEVPERVLAIIAKYRAEEDAAKYGTHKVKSPRRSSILEVVPSLLMPKILPVPKALEFDDKDEVSEPLANTDLPIPVKIEPKPVKLTGFRLQQLPIISGFPEYDDAHLRAPGGTIGARLYHKPASLERAQLAVAESVANGTMASAQSPASQQENKQSN